MSRAKRQLESSSAALDEHLSRLKSRCGLGPQEAAVLRQAQAGDRRIHAK